ncbi:hypothetical protein F2Q68_00002048 [Brassica cretica]|uniref:Uncharacterized protein n=1 Tax=Brassica cretica TaxID=69181 RepID=A0A8S9J7C4_BRACR|nr:hypothetical protein F2Q68_00002048 [Brassica cretica]
MVQLIQAVRAGIEGCRPTWKQHESLQENSGILTDIPTENEILGISRGISEDIPRKPKIWFPRNFLGIYRRNSEELSDELVVLGMSSEICFLGIPLENSEGFPRKEEIPRSYFRGLVSSITYALCSNGVIQQVSE